MVSVITWQTIYLNGIIHSFDLAKANMHVAEEKSVTHKTQNTRRAFLCVTDKRDNCSTYFLPDTRCIINMSAIFNLFLSDTFFQITDNSTAHNFTINLRCSQIFMSQ